MSNGASLSYDDEEEDDDEGCLTGEELGLSEESESLVTQPQGQEGTRGARELKGILVAEDEEEEELVNDIVPAPPPP